LRLPPAAALALALLGISSAAPLARLAGVDGYTAAWWRLLVGSLATLAAALALGRLPPRGLLLSSLPPGALLAAHLALWLESLRHMSVASSTGIVVSYPVFAAVYEALAEGVTVETLLGAVLGFAGVAVLSTPWSGATPLGAALSLSAAAAAAGYFILGRRLRVKGAGVVEYTLSAYGAAWLLLTAAAPLLDARPWSPPGHSIPYLILLGLLPMLLGHTMLNYALGYLPASTVTTVALLEPYGASLLAWLLLSEPPPPAALPGMALSVAGAWLSLRGARRRGRGG